MAGRMDPRLTIAVDICDYPFTIEVDHSLVEGYEIRLLDDRGNQVELIDRLTAEQAKEKITRWTIAYGFEEELEPTEQAMCCEHETWTDHE
jgi:hypothetical protein